MKTSGNYWRVIGLSMIVVVQLFLGWSLLRWPNVTLMDAPMRLSLVVGSQVIIVFVLGYGRYGTDRLPPYIAVLVVLYVVSLFLVLRMEGASIRDVNPIVRTESFVSAIILFGFAAVNSRLLFPLLLRRI